MEVLNKGENTLYLNRILQIEAVIQGEGYKQNSANPSPIGGWVQPNFPFPEKGREIQLRPSLYNTSGIRKTSLK